MTIKSEKDKKTLAEEQKRRSVEENYSLCLGSVSNSTFSFGWDIGMILSESSDPPSARDIRCKIFDPIENLDALITFLKQVDPEMDIQLFDGFASRMYPYFYVISRANLVDIAQFGHLFLA